MVALIPARAGSKRCPGKNTRLLAGHPLIAYTIAAAQQSGVFNRICIATDDPVVRALTPWDGRTFFHDRRPASDDQPDIEWVREVLSCHGPHDAFAILRPTSPFRTAATIQRAYAQFHQDIDSLRAVEPWTGPHPGKMWTYCAVTCRLSPVMTDWTAHAPYHSSPTQSLVPVVRQNASLEMAWTRNVWADPPTIAGTEIAAIFTDSYEGFDINTEADFAEAERLAAAHPELLPRIGVAA